MIDPGEAIELADGRRIYVRPIAPDLEACLRDGIRMLSPETRRKRFLSPKSEFSDDELYFLTRVDGHKHLALAAGTLAESTGEFQVIGVARCVRDNDESESAEVAIVLIDAWHGQGVGSILFTRLAACAWDVGIRIWHGYQVSDNLPVTKLFRKVGDKLSSVHDYADVYHVTYRLRPPSSGK